MTFQIVLDRSNQFGDVVETAAANPLVGNLSKPTLDQIQPRTRRRDEVDMESGMSSHPGFDPFLGSAKRCLEKTHGLLGTFYDCPNHGPNFQSYRQWMGANRSSSQTVLELLDADKDWIRFIAEARNALPVNHARKKFILEVQNFRLQPGNKFSGPSWRYDLSDRGGPVQDYWSNVIMDMNTHMQNMLTFLEEVYILCILDRCDQQLPLSSRYIGKPQIKSTKSARPLCC